MIEGRDGISVGTATLASGKVTISASALTHGARSRTVVYSGSVKLCLQPAMRFSSRPGGNPEVKQSWPPTHGLQSSVTVVATLAESAARLRDRCSFIRVIASKNSSRCKRKNSRLVK